MNERLKELRQYLKLSQEEFGEKIFMTQNHISSLESGRRIPSDRTIKNICTVFGVNEEWLRMGNGEMMIDLVDELEDIDDETKDMLKKLQKLSPDDYAKVKRIIDIFLND